MANQSPASATHHSSDMRAYRPVFARPDTVQEMFVTDSWTNILRRTEIVCSQMQPLMTITGDAGTGKSTMARWLYETLPLNNHEAVMVSLIGREIQGGWLIPKIAKFMGVGAINGNMSDLLSLTLEKLEELIQERRSLTVIVDAAEKIMTPEAFGEIEALLNLQSLCGRCMTFILVGNKTTLAQMQGSESLAAQLSYNAEVSPLSRKEAKEYVATRMQQAGSQITVQIADDAVDAAYSLTKGVIARLNSLMENCLVEAAIAKRDVIDAPYVHAIAKQSMPNLANAPAAASEAASAKPAKQTLKAAPPAKKPKTSTKKPVKDKATAIAKEPKKIEVAPAVENTAAVDAVQPKEVEKPKTKEAAPAAAAKATTKKPKIALTDLFNDEE